MMLFHLNNETHRAMLAQTEELSRERRGAEAI
jgi:hypothetical protein